MFVHRNKFKLSRLVVRSIIVTFAVVLVGAISAPCALANSPAIVTKNGPVKGISIFGMEGYLGIPYAVPPVGDLRWKKPQTPAAWQGTKQATEFPKACMQAPYPQNSIYYRPAEPMSEDCLYLNIWTAAQSAKERRPVMVWVHGGGFTRE